MPVSTVLVPLDGSDRSAQALGYLPALKGISRFHVALIGVAPDESGRRAVGDYLEDLAARTAESTGLKVSWSSHSGSPQAHIQAQASGPGVDLVLMATHGRNSSEPWRLGSVADKVIRGATCPSLLISAEAASGPAPAAFSRIMVPLDGSNLAEEALPAAQTIAARLKAKLRLVTAYSPEPVPAIPWPDRSFGDSIESSGEAAEAYLERQLAGDAAVERSAVHGLPTEVLLEQIEVGAVDLVIMTSHGRSGFVRWALGSVADRLIRGPVPVLVLHPGQAGHLTRLLASGE
jgi:nucleotide-binding universal stress UspA family protein